MALGSNLKRKKSTAQSKPDSAIKEVKAMPEEELVDEKNSIADDLQDVAIAAVNHSSLMLVAFKIGSEEYGIPISEVKEVVPTPRITKVPQAPDSILGMTNVRGNVYAVLDVASKMGIEEKANHHKPYLLVLKSTVYSAALQVNGIPNTKEVHEENLDRSYEFTSHTNQDMQFVEGLIKENGKILVLLDAEKMVESVKMNNQ